ncbi:MAG TPA: site-specific integrase [Bryobacteraceae bacterium]|jgi:site-specific recombinase XerD
MSRAYTESLLTSTQDFFQKYLRQTRGASAHTVRAYRDALKLFFLFLADHEHKPIASLTLDDVRAKTVLAFLEHIESKRGNSAITRNCRLAAVRSFVQLSLRHAVTRAGPYGSILAIKTKRATRRTVTYLEPEEARALIAAVDAHSRHSDRDRALLLFLYNTGARVAEALSLRSPLSAWTGPGKFVFSAGEARNGSVHCGRKRRRPCVESLPPAVMILFSRARRESRCREMEWLI